MKKYLAVTICALSAAAAVTACSAGERNGSEYKAGKYEESSVVTTSRSAVASEADTPSSKREESSSKREESSSRRDTESSMREDESGHGDKGDVMSRVGEGIDDILDGGNEVIDDTIDTGKDVVDDIFE